LPKFEIVEVTNICKITRVVNTSHVTKKHHEKNVVQVKIKSEVLKQMDFNE
jgi:hypothetical protein